MTLAQFEHAIRGDVEGRMADLIDGSIGEASLFHDTFGYYARGVVESTARLPAGRQERLVRFETLATRGVTAWCLELHDLWIAKAVAGRDKDREFAAPWCSDTWCHLRCSGPGCRRSRTWTRGSSKSRPRGSRIDHEPDVSPRRRELPGFCHRVTTEEAALHALPAPLPETTPCVRSAGS